MKKKSCFCLGLMLSVVLAVPLLTKPSFAVEENKFILPQYSQKVSLDFKNADLRDVLKAFSKQLGVNFLIDTDVVSSPVTVFLENVPVEDALEKLISANGLSYEYDQVSNIIVVKKKVVSADDSLTTRIYQLRYATVASSKLASALAASANTSGGLTSSTSSTATTTTSDTVGIAAAIKIALMDKTNGKVIEDDRTNSLIITDTQKNFVNIEKLLARIDVPVPQVLIEVEMLDVSKQAVDELGVRYGDSATDGLFNIDASDLDLEAHGGYSRYGNTLKFLEYGKLTTTFSAAFDFLRTRTDTKSLARPRIMTLDNQTAQIRISTSEVIGATVTTDPDTGEETVDAERVDTGIMMVVTPQVSLMTDEITLVVEPKVVNASQKVSFDGHEFTNPEERGVKVILKVKNGETIVIGGLLRNEEVDGVDKLPILGDIPFFGAPFRHKSKTHTERELLIFMTPRILDSSAGAPVVRNEAMALGVKREQLIPDSRVRTIDGQMDKVTAINKGNR